MTLELDHVWAVVTGEFTRLYLTRARAREWMTD